MSAEAFDAEFASLAALGSEVVTVFHAPMDATEAAIDTMRAHWSGPICVYPEGTVSTPTGTIPSRPRCLPMSSWRGHSAGSRKAYW